MESFVNLNAENGTAHFYVVSGCRGCHNSLKSIYNENIRFNKQESIFSNTSEMLKQYLKLHYFVLEICSVYLFRAALYMHIFVLHKEKRAW
jgi:hypothetical protein